MLESRASSQASWDRQPIRFVVSRRVFAASDLIETAIIAAGGNITEGYFRLLELPISEFIMTTEAWLKIAQAKANAEKSATGNSSKSIVGGDMDWIPEE